MSTAHVTYCITTHLVSLLYVLNTTCLHFYFSALYTVCNTFCQSRAFYKAIRPMFLQSGLLVDLYKSLDQNRAAPRKRDEEERERERKSFFAPLESAIQCWFPHMT